MIPAVAGDDELMFFRRHSCKCLDEPFQVFSGFEVPDIKKIRTHRLCTNRLKFPGSGKRSHPDTIFGNTEMTNDFPLRELGIRDDQSCFSRNAGDETLCILSFRQRMSMTQNLDSHVVNSNDIRPLFGYWRQKVRVVTNIGPDRIENSRQHQMEVKRAYWKLDRILEFQVSIT